MRHIQYTLDAWVTRCSSAIDDKKYEDRALELQYRQNVKVSRYLSHDRIVSLSLSNLTLPNTSAWVVIVKLSM